MIDYLILPFALGLGFLFIKILFSFLTGNGNSNSKNYYEHHEPRKPKHTFTNDEILSQGIDIRIPEHRQELLLRRGRNERASKTVSKAEEIIRRK